MPTKKKYAANWQKRRREYLIGIHYTCEHCGVRRDQVVVNRHGKMDGAGIQVHHPNGDTENPDAILIALCESCHQKDEWRMRRREDREAELTMQSVGRWYDQ